MATKLFLSMAFISLPLFVNAQTSLSPMVLADLQKHEFIYYPEELSPSWAGSFGLGLAIEQGIVGGFGLGYELDFTKKNVSVESVGFAPVDGWSYTQMRQTLLFKYYAFKQLHFSVGMNLFANLNNKSFIEGRHFGSHPKTSHYSIIGSARLKLDPITLDFYITKSTTKEELYLSSFWVNDSMSLGVKLGYPILLFKKREVSKVRCPKF